MTESERLRQLEDRLWKSADKLRANSSLAASQYSIPVLGLIFLRYADVRFTQLEAELEGKSSGRREIGRSDYQARGVMYMPEPARFSYLRELPERTDLGQAVNQAMEAIETENPDLKGVLPRDYARFDSSVLAELLRLIGTIPDDIEGDAFGKIYEYFLANFAFTEGQRGGEFFTPTSIVKLIVDIIEPYSGRVLDWKQRQTTRARVEVGIQDVLNDGLPEVYDRALFARKTAAVFEHVFSAYQGDGKSIYQEVA